MSDQARPAGIIHDIRNLMTVISMNSALLSDRMTSEKCPLISGIVQATDYLESLIDDLQSATQPAADLRPANVVETLQQAKEFAKAIHPNVAFELLHKSNTTIHIGQSKLLRCLLNLVGNAAEAAVSNSQTQPVVILKVTHSPKYLSIHVLDSGTGFPVADTQQDFFAPFVTQRFTNAEKHSGLGLYVVRSIVDEYCGNLIATRNGQFTELRMEFPRSMIVQESRP